MWLAMLLVGCVTSGVLGNPDSGAGDTATADTSTPPEPAEMWHGCGVGDRPTLQVGIDGAAQSCDLAVAGQHEVELDLWSNLPAADNLPDTLTVGTNLDSSDGNATWCPGHSSPCQQATSGTVVITSYVDGTSGAGTYSLDLPGGHHVQGSFSATFCQTPLCG